MSKGKIRAILTGAFAIMLLVSGTFAQESWLSQKPIENWNTKSMRVPAAPSYDPQEVERCGHTIRPATTIADKVVEGRGWKIIGAAHVWGDTSVIEVTKGFDGQCRPYDYQAMVFVRNKFAGTLSPDFMVSRTDGALYNIDLYSADSLRAEYSRYKSSDAMCCPSMTEAVYFTLDEESSMVIPGDSYIISGGEEEAASEGMKLDGTKWQWVATQTPVGKIEVKEPSKYTLEFMADGKAAILADCNRGTGTFKAEGASLSFSPFAVTKMACPAGSQDARFLKDLEYVRIMKMEGDKLFLDLFADGGTMEFTKIEN